MRTPLDRAAFVIDPAITYLNHAAVGILPVATRDALHGFVDAHAARGVLGVYKNELDLPAYRRSVADLIGAEDGEIAFLRIRATAQRFWPKAWTSSPAMEGSAAWAAAGFETRRGRCALGVRLVSLPSASSPGLRVHGEPRDP
jgi:hypothetical protein